MIGNLENKSKVNDTGVQMHDYYAVSKNFRSYL